MLNMSPEIVNINVNEKGYKRKLSCSQRVFNLITIQCIKEYLKHHPEMRGANITQNHILSQISEHYLKSP